MKRRLFAAILAALILAALILPAAADTFIYLWTSNLHDEPEDPMAFTSYSAAEGYKTPSRVYDYEKLAGNMDSLEEAGRLEGETFQKKIGPYITKYVKETKFVNFQARYNAWQQLYGDLALKGASKEASVALTDVVDKYIVELFGAGIGKVKELTVDKVNTSSRFEYKEGALYFTFALGLSQYTMHEVSLNLNRMLMNIASPGYTMLYDLIFGQVPAAESTIQVPKDPPLPPEKK